MTTARVLVIDDNPDVAKALTVLFKINHIETDTSLSPADAMHKLKTAEFDLVIQDMNFSSDTTSGEEGIALFKQIRELHVDMPIILMTAWTQLEMAVELVKSGAADYISKPWDDDKLLVTVQNLLALGGLRKQQRQQQNSVQLKYDELASQYDLCGLRFQSQTMYDLLRITTQVAHADVSVLITGPNGAGKEKIAEIVQANSSCKHGPFIKVNVGALPKDLMEAELFGAEAGAYTGITKQRKGRFELAHNGTLFLDEIGNLSLEGQAKLLRVLETGEFERIGGHQTIKVNVRIISATNADLKSAIADGQFREDLFYRLNVIELALPPLNKRKADILPLAYFFLAKGKQLAEEAEQVLQQHHWPGNIRELKNVMQRASLLSPGDLVSADALGLEIPLVADKTAAKEPSQDEIQQAISDAKGVMSEAAKLLGISRPALYRRLKKLEQNAS